MNMCEKQKQIINILENKILEMHLLLKDSNSKRHITKKIHKFFPLQFFLLQAMQLQMFFFWKLIFQTITSFLQNPYNFLVMFVCLLCCIVIILINFFNYVIRMESLPNFLEILIIISRTSTLMNEVIILFLTRPCNMVKGVYKHKQLQLCQAKKMVSKRFSRHWFCLRSQWIFFHNYIYIFFGASTSIE